MRAALLSLAVLAAASLAGTPAARERRPNILFLLADDQRPDAVHAFGNEHIRTPNLDRLAARGFRFERNYCFGSIHGAVCQPSRAMLMSGRTLWRVPMDLAGVRTLPRALAEVGYVTFATGKWHNGAASLRSSFQHGRACFLGGMSDHTKVPLVDLDEEGRFVNERVGEGFSSELFADAAIEFLESRAGTEKPFFCYVAFTAPHDPRMPPLAFREPYYRDLPPLPANFLPQHPFQNGWLTGRDEQLAPWPRPPAMIRRQLAEYYGMITHLDREVGRILAALERLGLAEDTLVVYTADHGLALGSHGLLGKQSVYEHSMGCPLIVAGPGVPHGSTRALTYLLDLYPTLCELAGAKLDDTVEGESLAPLWRGERAAVRTSLFLAYEDLMRAVRDERWKLIRYPKIDRWQLFDLERDPAEMHDLAADPAQAERIAGLRALMERWRARTADPHPLEVEHPDPPDVDLTGHPRRPDGHQPAWIVEAYYDV